MKVVWIALAILLALCIFIVVHSYIMSSTANDILLKCAEISSRLPSEDWEAILEKLDKIEEIWEKHRTWAALTISTKDIEEIEVAFYQSLAYAEARQTSGFIGEFVMFTKLVEHIPTREGLHWEEIL